MKHGKARGVLLGLLIVLISLGGTFASAAGSTATITSTANFL